jgi:adenylate cyclase
MTLRTRMVLMVTVLLVFALGAATAALTWTARQSMLAQTEDDGWVIAASLARSVAVTNEIPREVEDAFGERMIDEATILAHLVADAERAGMNPDKLTSQLREITQGTALDEIWITDSSGHAYLHSEPNVDFTFSPDAEKQPQSSAAS